jgi:hypothetical protein
VSLLTSRDGTHMVAQVGRTGNDFLHALRAEPSGKEKLPSAPSSAQADDAGAGSRGAGEPAEAFSPPLAANATVLMATTAVGNMPVIYATGHSFADMERLRNGYVPFGLSESSYLLEGAVKGPFRTMKRIKGAKAKRRPITVLLRQ